MSAEKQMNPAPRRNKLIAWALGAVALLAYAVIIARWLHGF